MSKTTKKKAPTGTKAKATKATSGDTDMKNLLGLMQGMMQKTEPSHAHAHAAPASRTHIKEHGINSLSELRDDMTMLSSSLTGRITQVEAKVGSLSDSMDEIKEMMKVRNAKFDQELQNCTKHTAELVEEERAKRLKLLKALQKKLSDDDVVIMERVSKMKDEVTKVTAGLSADIQGTFTELTKLKGNVESSSQQRTQWQQQSSSTAEKLNSKLKILEVKLNASNNGLFVAADDGCLNDNGSDFPDDASDDFISNMHIDSSSHQQQFMRTRYRSQSGSSQGPAFSQRPKVPVERVLQELRQQMGKLESNVESTSTIANDAYVACTGKSHRMMNAVLSASSNSNSNSHGHSHSQSLHRKHGGSSRSSRRADSGSDSESDDDVNNHAKLSLRSQQAEVKALAKRVKTLGENTSKACRTLSSGLTDVQQSTLFLYAWCDKAHDAFSVVSSQLGLTTNICPRVQVYRSNAATHKAIDEL